MKMQLRNRKTIQRFLLTKSYIAHGDLTIYASSVQTNEIGCRGLNKKCLPCSLAFKHSIASWWQYLGRLRRCGLGEACMSMEVEVGSFNSTYFEFILSVSALHYCHKVCSFLPYFPPLCWGL